MSNEQFNEIMTTLKAMDERLTGKIETLSKDVGILKEDVNELKEDVGVLKERVDELKEDVGVLKERTDKLQEDVEILKERTDKLQVDVDGLKETTNQINKNLKFHLKAVDKVIDHVSEDYNENIANLLALKHK